MKRSRSRLADQLAGGAIAAGRVAAHQCGRHPFQLAQHQVGGRRQLVGHRHLRGSQRVAGRIRLAVVAAQRLKAADPDGRAHDPVSQRPAHRVGHHHRQRHPTPPLQLRPQRPRRRVRVDRQQHHLVVARRVRTVDPGAGADEPVVRLGDQQRPAPPHDPPALAKYHLGQARVAVRRGQLDRPRRRRHLPQVGHPTLRLADRLVRHHHHIAPLQRRRGRQQQRCQIRARLDLAGHGQRQDLEPHAAIPAASSAARASRSRAAASRMMVSTTTARMPSCSTRAASSASCSSSTSTSASPW